MGERCRGQIRKSLGSGENIRFILNILGNSVGFAFGQEGRGVVTRSDFLFQMIIPDVLWRMNLVRMCKRGSLEEA